MSDDYKRGYAKGYNTRVRLSDEAVARAEDRAMRAVKRAENAEAATVGHCDTCTWWERPTGCAWGRCRVPDDSAGSPWGCWVHPASGDREGVITSPKFGCVLWLKTRTE